MANENNLLTQIDTLLTANPALRLYAIADPAQDTKLRTHYFVKTNINTQSSLLDPSDTSTEAATVAPFLVQIPKPREDVNFWKGLEGYAKQVPPALTILASAQPFQALHKHLAYFTEVHLPDDSAMILAYWDPAILGTLLGNAADTTLHVQGPVLTEKQRSALLSPVAAWWYWDRGGNLQRLESQGPSATVNLETRIKLVQVQVDMLVEASVPDHIISHFQVNQPALLAPIAPGQKYAQVEQHLLGARKLHLEGMADILNYVAAGLIYGDRLKAETEIVDLLTKVRARELNLTQALGQFP